MPSERAKDRTLYARALKKRAAGKPLSYAERQRLDLGRDRRVAREEATWKKDHARSMSDAGQLRFARTRFGWRVVVPNDHPGGPWSSKDEIEVVTRTGKLQWVTLVKLWFTGGDAKRSEWWSFVAGRQSAVELHIPKPLSAPPPPEQKQADNLLDDEDMDRVSTGAGAAYLAARKARARQATP